METTPARREKRVAQLTQRRGLTTKIAVLFEDRLEIRTSTFLGEVRSALELDAIEGISHVRGANVALTMAASATLMALLSFGIAVLTGGATAADLRMLSILGGLAAVLSLAFLFVRENTFRVETYRKGRFTLFADHEPDTAVFEFLGAVRRARQRHLLKGRAGIGSQAVAEELRKLRVGPDSSIPFHHTRLWAVGWGQRPSRPGAALPSR
ncbi:MAG: hypothetical protein HY303_05225 [Candidatus Wallbacteria bacterium]|nr:hypothetical protein [Candidatus Wallbacteria bacterium]